MYAILLIMLAFSIHLSRFCGGFSVTFAVFVYMQNVFVHVQRYMYKGFGVSERQ